MWILRKLKVNMKQLTASDHDPHTDDNETEGSQSYMLSVLLLL